MEGGKEVNRNNGRVAQFFFLHICRTMKAYGLPRNRAASTGTGNGSAFPSIICAIILHY